jgi:Mg/Co/Ni transporter MgtE
MLAEKRALSIEELEAQTALELPARETPATVVIGCLAVCIGQIRIQNVSVDVAAQVCAAVQALNVTLLGLTGTQLSCTIRQ